MKDNKLTNKQMLIIKKLVEHYLEKNEGQNCYEFIKSNKELLKENNISIDKINSVNATLASLAIKELVTKNKKEYQEKLITYYTPTAKAIELISKENQN